VRYNFVNVDDKSFAGVTNAAVAMLK